jgi:hypothetical protein
MNGLKKNLVPILFAFASVTSLIPAVVGPVIKGEPVNYGSSGGSVRRA